MRPVHQDERPHGDPGRAHVNEQERDAFLALAGRAIGAHEAEDPVGVMRERGPDLLAIDDVVLAMTHGAHVERSEIAARAGLRVALAPEVVAVIDTRQEPLFLRLAAKAQQHRPAHREAERHQRRAAGIAELFLEDVALDHVPAGAAPFARPRRCHPALFCEYPVPAQQLVFREVLVALDFLAQLRRQVGAKPRAHFIAERQLLGGVIEVHGGGREGAKSNPRRANRGRSPI